MFALGIEGPATLSGQSRQTCLHGCAHRLEAGAALGLIIFGQGHHPQRQRDRKQCLKAAGFFAQPDDLGRTAANIEDQRALVFAPDQGGAAQRRQIGFLVGADDRQIDSRLGAGAGDQDIAVGGQPRRLGGDGADMANLMLGDPLGADFKRRDRAVEGGLRQSTAGRNALAQPHNAGKGIHHPKSVIRGGAGDQKPAIVGAQIQHRQQRRAAAAPMGRRLAFSAPLFEGLFGRILAVCLQFLVPRALWSGPTLA